MLLLLGFSYRIIRVRSFVFSFLLVFYDRTYFLEFKGNHNRQVPTAKVINIVSRG